MGTQVDLQDLGIVCATADYAKDYTFYLLVDRAHYTPEALEKNPACIAPADLLFQSSPIPDKDGMAECDLSAHSRAITDKYNGDTKGKLAVIATSQATNKDPHKKLAIVEACELIAPKLKLVQFGYRVD